MEGNNSGTVERSECSFLEWMKLQEEDLSEMLQALSTTTTDTADEVNIDEQNNNNSRLLTGLIHKALSHFESYISRRSDLSRLDAPAFYAPKWCTQWENSLMWIAGCRPSSYFRLIYASLISSLDRSLTSGQLRLIDDLHRRTVREEDRLSTAVAGLQEDVADHPVAAIAKGSASINGEMSSALEAALDAHEGRMAAVLEEADRLRMKTLKQLLEILSPTQSVEFLAMSKKLHLCIHKWSQIREQKHGRSQPQRPPPPAPPPPQEDQEDHHLHRP